MNSKHHEPKHRFTIPSLYDGTSLDCRIFHPEVESSSDPNHGYNGAIVAHPYGPLGGSYDDPVVAAAVAQLLECGFYVGTFNFRKPGIWKGNTSFSGTPELHDYVTFLSWLSRYLVALRSAPTDLDTATQKPLKMVLAGYSYGSMIASRVPSASRVLEVYNSLGVSLRTNKFHPDIVGRARSLASGSEAQGELERTEAEDVTISNHYLMISPLLGAVSFFVAPTMKNLFKKAAAPDVEYAQLIKYDTLAVWGDADGFTSDAKLTQWAEALASAPYSRFRYKSLQDVDHFWHELGAIQQMQREVKRWVDECVLPKT